MSLARWERGRLATDVVPLSNALRANNVLDHILTDYATGHTGAIKLNDALDQVERLRSAIITLKEMHHE